MLSGLMFRRTALCLLVTCIACSEEAPPAAPDAGTTPDAQITPDAGPPDAGPPDTGIGQDAGAPPDSGVLWAQSSCADCSTGCTGGTCLNTQTESFCSDACDQDVEGCADGFSCIDISGDDQGQYFCIPPGASCEFDSARYGTSCYGDTTGCLPGMNHCEGDFHSLGYCTIRCLETPECPTGYECRPGDSGYDVCAPATLGAAEYCARTNQAAEPPCAIDLDCAALPGSVCVRSDLRLPGVCSLPCDTAATCGDGQVCADTHRGFACLSTDCDCHAQPVPEGTRDLLGEALAQVQRSRCTLGWTVHDWKDTPADILYDPYRLSWFDRAHNEPLEGFGFAKTVVSALDAHAETSDVPAAQAARMVQEMAQLVDRPATLHAPGNLDASAPLVEAVAELIETAGGTADRMQITREAQQLPEALRRPLAQIVDAIRRGVIAQRTAVPRERDRESLFDYGPAFVVARADRRGLDATSTQNRNLLNRDIGYGEIYGAAVDLLDTIAQANLHTFASGQGGTATATATLLFNIDTPVGRITVGDGQSGIYDPRAPGMDGAWALLIDLGGDDEYRVPAGGTQSANNPVSLMIDLGGNDVYGYVTTPDPYDEDRLPSDEAGRYVPQAGPDEDNGPISFSQTARQGAGRMGVGLLVDMGAGQDHYQSLRMSQGAGFVGVGVLVDEGGDDTYLAEAASQGGAAFGIGLLYDAGGDDIRRSYTMSQGFAYARAAGLVYDKAGNDQYLMDSGDPAFGGDPLYFSSQRRGRANSTLGQGFAFGRRADFTDRAFMSGGIGMLIDAKGEDRYEGSIFAQGGGFWFGTGILADHEGNDTYDGLWYAMGAAAHYSMGFFLEGAGNDIYGAVLPRVNVTIGGGHDFSSVFFVDESGNDTYLGSRITIGAGNLNGIGVFVDNAGDDRYEARSTYGVGGAGVLEADAPGSHRRKIDTFGIFIDASGNDTYELESMEPFLGRANDSSWLSNEHEDPLVNLIELGSGLDGTGESTLHLP